MVCGLLCVQMNVQDDHMYMEMNSTNYIVNMKNQTRLVKL